MLTHASTEAESVQAVTIKNPAAVALGKLGASKGGRARATALSKKRRKEIAQAAAAVRWSKNLPEPD